MERSDPRYQAYVEILKEELIPAMGCTEPIALAYAAAKAREVLGMLPESVQLQVSGSIIKNVKSVIVPNTGHLKGMEAAVAAGIIAGSADRELEVISEVSEDKKAAIRDYLQTVPISIQHIEQGHVFDIIVTERSGDSYAKVRIAGFHTNICLIEKNGRVLLSTYGNDVSIRAKAKAAAGSDARMNGCELPVIINSGSGTLSAYCGAVSAGAGAGAGIVYLCGDGYQAAIHTVVNALAIVSGIVCDGAKASCAAKIASSVDAALLGYNMYKCHQEFKGGDGIVMKDIETTIKGIGRLGKDGMKETNEEIIRLMIE